LLDFLNEDFLAEMKFDLQKYTLGIFRFNETYLGFEDGYLSFGFSADFSNTTVLKSMANTYMANYLETNIPTADLEMPQVEPHILTLMEETERGYQALIRSN